MGNSRWRIRDGSGDLIVEARNASRDDGPPSSNAYEIASLLERAIRLRDPHVHRTLCELHATLHGTSLGLVPSLGLLPFEKLCSELAAASREGRITVRREARRAVIVPIDVPAEEVLGPAAPDSAPAPDLVWIGINLVDQDGKPVPNRPYRVIGPDQQTYSGSLDSHATAFVRNLPPGNCQVYCPDYPPHDELTYVVKPREHVSGIALQNGFEDYTVVWGHAKNKDLASKRDLAHALNEGDEVYIPALKATPVNKPTGAKHQFQIKLSPLKLRVKLIGTDMKPVTNAACTLDGTSLTSDGDGVVEVPIDKLATSSTIIVDGTNLAVAIGRLNTHDDTTEAGWKGRLFNLGFLLDPTLPDDDAEVVFALQDFQAEHKLDVSGSFDDATKSKIKDVHGA
jgi:hypothetical protein